jgi:TonB family protein
MIKTFPLVAAILFFASCNHTTPPKPDADRVIKDTLAEIILQPFNQSPQAQNIYVHVEATQEKVPCCRSNAIKQVMEDLKTQPQKFVIDNSRPAEITGEEGTKLAFTPNSFISSNGSEVSAPVTIELKECYNINAMLRENLLTSTDGGFSASRVMLCVNAFADGQPLQLKDGETINVHFPFYINNFSKSKLYHGNENADGLIVWSTATEEKATGPEIYPSTSFLKPEFSYQNQDFKAYLLQNLNYPDEARRNELSANVEVTFTVSKYGKVTNVITAESYKIFRQEIEQAFATMPVWKPAVYNGKNIASSVHASINFNIRSADQVQVDFNESKSSLISAGNELYVLYGSDLKRQSPDVSGLPLGKTGWFNYSKPLDGGDQNAELIVCSNEKTEVKLLLKNKIAIIGGENCLGFADFKNLPLGEEAYIVAVRYENGNMLYSVQPVTFNKQSIITLKWKKGDKEEITRAYRKLSKDLS